MPNIDERYRPANAFEGMAFEQRWCDRCKRDEAFLEDRGDSCPIHTIAVAVSRAHPDFPDEWRCDGPSGPRCTAFEPIDPFNVPLDPAAVVAPLPFP